jgi:hypothetical protein
MQRCPLLVVSVFTDASNKMVILIIRKSLNISNHPEKKFLSVLLLVTKSKSDAHYQKLIRWNRSVPS